MRREPNAKISGPYWVGQCATCSDRVSSFFEDEAKAWCEAHVCEEQEEDGAVEITVTVFADDPPEVSWTGGPLQVETARVAEIALMDMRSAARQGKQKTWRAYLRECWERRRAAATEEVIRQAESFLERPYRCEGCKQRYSSQRGLSQHQRHCWVLRRQRSEGVET